MYIPAIEGYVPQDMVRTLHAFLEFCYLVRCSVITEQTLSQIRQALDRFHQLRQVFHPDIVTSFNLPRQHSMKHYPDMIQLFGAPNGLCSSITESKHIKAVKKPYRRSNRHNALGQMLLTNQRLDKLARCRVDFQKRGMLSGTCTSSVLMNGSAERNENTSDEPVEPGQNVADENEGEEDGEPVNVTSRVEAHVELACMPRK